MTELALQTPAQKLKYVIIKEDLIFIGVIFLVFMMNYFIPKSIGVILTLMITFYAYQTKYPVVPLLLFIIVVSRLNGLIDLNMLPRFSAGGFSVNLLDSLMFVFLLRVVQHVKNIRATYFGPFLLFFYLYLFVTIAYNAMISGFDFQIFVAMFRIYFYYLIYFYVLYAIRDVSDINLILKALFIITVFYFANQLSVVFFKRDFNAIFLHQETAFLSAKTSFANYTGTYQTDISRGYVRDILNPYLFFVLSLCFLDFTRQREMRNFLNLGIIIFIMMVFIAATRAWLIFTLLPIMAYTQKVQNFIRFSRIAVITVVLVLIIFVVIGGFNLDYFKDIFLRLSGVVKVLSPKSFNQVETAVSRTQAAGVMLDYIMKNPIFGYGFSRVTTNIQDSDLGCLNTILTFGILGFFIFLYMIIKYLLVVNQTLLSLSRSNPYRTSLSVLRYVMVAMLIGYLTTWDFFSILGARTAYTGLFLGVSEFIVRESLKYEKLVRTNILHSQAA